MRWQSYGEPEDAADEGGPGGTNGSGPDPDAAFWASPVGLAARAMLRGDRFFQIELDGDTLSEYAETAVQPHGRRARRTCDLLGQIEELGWHLEHATWWRVDDPAASPAPPPDPAGGADHVRGVYLFHSVPTADEDVPVHAAGSDGPAHAPTHRRDVS
jgi:hypothetical protein